MLSLCEPAHFNAALTSLSGRPYDLLKNRVELYAAAGVLEMTHLLVVQAGDTESDIISKISLSPLCSPLDGNRFGSPAFQPWWDHLQDLGGWFELIITVGNSGFAFVLLIEDVDGVDPGLRSLCHTFARAS